MIKQEFLKYCLNTYGTSPDYPFDDWMESAVLRHADTRKWYAIVLRVARHRLGLAGDGEIDVVNLKLPIEMFGSFGAADGVYPAYHMNKLHWISLVLGEATDETVRFLTGVSYEATRAGKRKSKRNGKEEKR